MTEHINISEVIKPITLTEARQKGKLEEFIKELPKDPKGDKGKLKHHDV